MKKNLLILLGLTIIAALYPAFDTNFLAIPIMALLFIGWATSWDILGGWAGQVSLGHVAFVGIGAYFVAVGYESFGIAPWWSILMAIVFTAILSSVWGLLTFKLQGVYFAMSTIAIAEMIRLIAINEGWLTGGPTGVFMISLPTIFGFDLLQKSTQYYLALAFAAINLLIIIIISQTKLGYQLRAVREDEQSAMAAGINPLRVKMIAFIISSVLTTLGGGIYGLFLSFMEPDVLFNLFFSIQIALTAIVGGRGTIWGPGLGAIILVGASEIFRTTFAQANMLVYGVLILLVMLFYQRGILGEIMYNRIRKSYADRTQS